LVLDLDAYLNTGDSVFYTIVDTNIVKTPNQRELISIDSTESTNLVKSINTYSYVEFPIIFGYQFKHNKFILTPKIGLITGIYIKSQGKILTSSFNAQEIPNDQLPYIKTNLSATTSIGLEYKMNEFYSIIADPYYRVSLNSIYKKQTDLLYKFNAYGIRLGVRYNF